MTETKKCHWHSRRKAVACGWASRKGYCRECWPANAKDPTRSAHVWSPPHDATIWLAALVALTLALVGGIGCGGPGFSSEPGARPAEDTGTEGSLGSATGAGGECSGGSPGGSGGSPGGSEGSGGSPGGSGGSGGSPENSGGSTIAPEDGGEPEAATGGTSGAGGSTGSGGSLAGSGGSLAGSGGSDAGASSTGGAVNQGAPCSNQASACDSSRCAPSCASECWGGPLNLHWLACCPVSGGCGCVEPTKCL